MPRPKVDARKLQNALAAVAAGVPQADAAARAGVGLNTLKRALADAQRRTPSPTAPSSPAPAPDLDEPEDDDGDAPPPAPGVLLSEVDAALEGLSADPEARIVGATLRQLVQAIPALDPVKLPLIANSVRTLCTTLREMRPPRPPAPDELDERLRLLDKPALDEIERYTAEADAAFLRRLGELRAWGAANLDPARAQQHTVLVDALTAPPAPALVAGAPAGAG